MGVVKPALINGERCDANPQQAGGNPVQLQRLSERAVGCAKLPTDATVRAHGNLNRESQAETTWSSKGVKHGKGARPESYEHKPAVAETVGRSDMASRVPGILPGRGLAGDHPVSGTAQWRVGFQLDISSRSEHHTVGDEPGCGGSHQGRARRIRVRTSQVCPWKRQGAAWSLLHLDGQIESGFQEGVDRSVRGAHDPVGQKVRRHCGLRRISRSVGDMGRADQAARCVEEDRSAEVSDESQLVTEQHTYSQPKEIWTGEVGAFEGFRFIETPRAYNLADAGAGSTVDVYATHFVGKESLAKAYSTNEGGGPQPRVILGPVVDKMMRFKPVSWYWLGGYSIFRQEAIWRVESASSIATNV